MDDGGSAPIQTRFVQFSAQLLNSLVVVIENDDDLETLRVKVKSLWSSRIQGRQGKI